MAKMIQMQYPNAIYWNYCVDSLVFQINFIPSNSVYNNLALRHIMGRHLNNDKYLPETMFQVINVSYMNRLIAHLNKMTTISQTSF